MGGHSPFFLSPIKEIASQVNPGITITEQGAEFVNVKIDLVLYYILNAVSETEHLIEISTVLIEQIVRATLQPAMAQWAIQEAHEAVQSFQEISNESEGLQKTGLVFPIQEIRKLLTDRHPKNTMTAAIFLTSTLEYVCADLLQASGNRCLESERDSISLNDILQTVTEDNELSKLFFVVSSDSENTFLRKPSFDGGSMQRSTSLLLPPSKRQSSIKYKQKEFTAIDAESHSSTFGISKADQNEEWDVPSISISEAKEFKTNNIVDDQNKDNHSNGGMKQRPLSISLSIENFQKLNLPGDDFLGKLKEVANEESQDTVPQTLEKLPVKRTLLLPTGEGSRRQRAASSPSSSEHIVLRVNLPDKLKTSVEVPKDMSCGELLRYVVQKRFMKFEEYLLRECEQLSGTTPVDVSMGEIIDSQILVGELKIKEVSLCPKSLGKPRSASKDNTNNNEIRTVYWSEDGKDVLILDLENESAQVVAGTIEKLVEKLADENRQETRYVDCVLLTHRFFTQSLNFFEQLYLRYMIQSPASPTPEEKEYFETWQKPIQRKVIAVMKWWVENYWHDFHNNASLLSKLLEFNDLIKSHGFIQECQSLEESMLSQLQSYRNLRTLVTSIQGRQSQFLILQTNDIANQLNLWNYELFQHIQPVEYVNNVLTKDPEMFPNLDLFIKRFEIESFWVATELCLEKDLKKRTQILDTFIKIAKICRDSNNYFSTFSIIGGLNLACVQKLKSSWAGVSSKCMEVLHGLEELMSPSQNMKNYREKMLTSHPPIIPVLPVYLKDLLFTHDGNKTFINGMVNFEKFKLIANQVRQIVALKSIPYERDDTPRGKLTREYVKNPVVIMDIAKLTSMANEYQNQS